MQLTQKQIKDVFVGAFEGGSNYWYLLQTDSCEAVRAKVSKEKNEYLSEAITEAVFKGAEVPIYDIENPFDVLGTLSKESIKNGLNKILTDGRNEIYIVKMGQDDASTSDVILQYCLMGELLFG